MLEMPIIGTHYQWLYPRDVCRYHQQCGKRARHSLNLFGIMYDRHQHHRELVSCMLNPLRLTPLLSLESTHAPWDTNLQHTLCRRKMKTFNRHRMLSSPVILYSLHA
jgi:hypothetical protein